MGGVISGTQGMNDEMAEIHLGISVGDTGHKSSSGHFRAHFKAVFVAQRFGQIVPDQLKALQGQCGAHMIALCGYNGFHRMAHGIQPGLGGQTVGHGHAVSGVYNGQSGNVVFRNIAGFYIVYGVNQGKGRRSARGGGNQHQRYAGGWGRKVRGQIPVDGKLAVDQLVYAFGNIHGSPAADTDNAVDLRFNGNGCHMVYHDVRRVTVKFIADNIVQSF